MQRLVPTIATVAALLLPAATLSTSARSAELTMSK
jgi:hypothetical protein